MLQECFAKMKPRNASSLQEIFPKEAFRGDWFCSTSVSLTEFPAQGELLTERWEAHQLWPVCFNYLMIITECGADDVSASLVIVTAIPTSLLVKRRGTSITGLRIRCKYSTMMAEKKRKVKLASAFMDYRKCIEQKRKGWATCWIDEWKRQMYQRSAVAQLFKLSAERKHL